MRDIVKLGIVLMLIAGIAGLGLAYMNNVTKPIIDDQRQQAKLEGLNEVYPGADEIKDETADYVTGDINPFVTEVNVAYKGGSPAGVIYTVEPSGYSGINKTLVAFDINNKAITAIKVLSHTETPGLGAQCTEPWFQDRFKDKSAEQELEVVKLEPVGENQILAITASTITSKSVTTGVNAARTHFMEAFAQ